jgi:hypothetical protein
MAGFLDYSDVVAVRVDQTAAGSAKALPPVPGSRQAGALMAE